MPHLTANRISRRFGSRLLFRDLSFQIADGEAMAVTGRNGSGKSTLLRIVAGVLTPSAGDVRLSICGREVARETHPLHVGLVAPYLNVYEAFTPRENLAFIARVRRIPDAPARISRTLEFVALDDRADDFVNTFSSGMKQRVKFAAALLSEPDILLLDEPRVNLDASGLEMVNRAVDSQRARGGLVLVATNDPSEADGYARRICIEDYD